MRFKDIMSLSSYFGGDEANFSISYSPSGDKNVIIPCPLAKWTHENGTDSHPGCSIKECEDGASPWRCFACGYSGGSLSGMVHEINKFDNHQHGDLQDWVDKLEYEDPITNLFLSLEALKDSGVPQNTSQEYEPLPPGLLSKYCGSVPNYILDRGISLETCKRWQLGYDKTESDPRVVFPVFDIHQDLVGLVGRAILPNQNRKYVNYQGFQKSLFLYGEHIAVQEDKPLVLVEGMIDALAVYETGKAIGLAILGASPTAKQVDKLEQLCGGNLVSVMFDSDGAGSRAASRLKFLAKGKVPLRFVDLSSDDGSKNDPADLHKSGELDNFLL